MKVIRLTSPDAVRRSACRKRDIVSSEPFHNISALRLPFLIALTTEEEIGTRSGRAGPSFSARPEKEAKGAVLHGTSAAERLRHVKSCSANLPKLDDSHRLKHMERFVFALRAKIPSRATQLVKRYAASASRQRPAAHKNAGYENNQKPCFFVHSFLLLDSIDKLRGAFLVATHP